MMINVKGLTFEQNTSKTAALEVVGAVIKSQRVMCHQTVLESIGSSGTIPLACPLIAFPSWHKNFSNFRKPLLKKIAFLKFASSWVGEITTFSLDWGRRRRCDYFNFAGGRGK